MMNGHNKKRLICGICFLLILFAALQSIRGILGTVEAPFVHNMYALEKNSVDVMFFGSSNVFANINPAILYEEAGIKSYTMAGSSQPIWNSYYFLREAYKTQHPKVVVIDMNSLTYNADYSSVTEAWRHIFGLRLSMNKLEAIKSSCADADTAISMVVGWPVFHTRWRDGKALHIDTSMGLWRWDFILYMAGILILE